VAGKIVPGVQDVTVTTSRTEVQVKVREHGDVRYLAGLKDTPIDFEMLDDPEDETYQALKAAYHSDTDDNFLEVEITDNPANRREMGRRQGGLHRHQVREILPGGRCGETQRARRVQRVP
jgi:hypothetical protein